MKLAYTLSGRQTKELVERGSALSIALPLPDDWDEGADPLAYARSVLRGIDRAWVREAEIIELPIVAPLGHAGGKGAPGSLADLWGQVAHEQVERDTALVYRVVAIVAVIASTDRPRRTMPTQWPAAVIVGAMRFPALASA